MLLNNQELFKSHKGVQEFKLKNLPKSIPILLHEILKLKFHISLRLVFKNPMIK